jgi:hypothetical protein
MREALSSPWCQYLGRHDHSFGLSSFISSGVLSSPLIACDYASVEVRVESKIVDIMKSRRQLTIKMMPGHSGLCHPVRDSCMGIFIWAKHHIVERHWPALNELIICSKSRDMTSALWIVEQDKRALNSRDSNPPSRLEQNRFKSLQGELDGFPPKRSHACTMARSQVLSHASFDRNRITYLPTE